MTAFCVRHDEIDLAEIDINPKHGIIRCLRTNCQTAEERNRGKMSEPSGIIHFRFLPQPNAEVYHSNSTLFIKIRTRNCETGSRADTNGNLDRWNNQRSI